MYSATVTSVAGTTAGIEIPDTTSSPYYFTSPPIKTAVTISGTMTFNVWAKEANNAANATVRVIVKRLDAFGVIQETIVDSSFGTELTTTMSAKNWTASPTSTNMLEGDRIIFFILFDDATSLTMASGHTLTVDLASIGGAGSDGDTWIQFNETVAFETGTTVDFTLYLRDTNAPASITTGATTKKMLSQIAGPVTSSTARTTTSQSSVAGWTTPAQQTKSGNTIEWYSEQMHAFTGVLRVYADFYIGQSSASANAGSLLEFALVDADGTNAVILGTTTQCQQQGGNLEVRTQFNPAPSDYDHHYFYLVTRTATISNGQRMRIRLFFDDSANAAQASGFSYGMHYDGAVGNDPVTGRERGCSFIAIKGLNPALPPDLFTLSLIQQIWRYTQC